MIGDPSTRDGNVFTIAGPQSTFEGERKTGGTDYVGKYDGVFGSRFLVNGMVARHNESDKFEGPGRDIPTSIDTTVAPTATQRRLQILPGSGLQPQRGQGRRDELSGGHDVKIGGDCEHIKPSTTTTTAAPDSGSTS